MKLIVFSGLPGTGKTSLAEAIGRQLGIPVFAKDWLEATLKRAQPGAAAEQQTGYAAYELLTTLAQRQLMLGQSAILDSVLSIEKIRDQWRTLAGKYQAQWRVIECTCSDENVHRQRLSQRQRGIPGWHELEWSEVERVKGYYAAWTEERLVIDTLKPPSENIREIFAYLQ